MCKGVSMCASVCACVRACARACEYVCVQVWGGGMRGCVCVSVTLVAIRRALVIM